MLTCLRVPLTCTGREYLSWLEAHGWRVTFDREMAARITWGHMVYLIDDEYLFTGDTIWLGADGGYSFISTLAEDNKLAVRSLERLERNIRARKGRIAVITGHTGWTDDLDFVFAHRTEICKPFTRHYTDLDAPYDGYEEGDDTEEGARSVPLSKKKQSRGTAI